MELFKQCAIFGTVQTVCNSWNCSDSVLFLELFRQCAIFGTVQTVCYFWNCSDSVLFLELFRQCAIFGTVQTVCYFWNCLDSLLLLELFRQCAIFVLFSLIDHISRYWLAYLSFIVSLFWCSNVWTNDLRNTLLVINLSNIVMALCTLLLLSSVIYEKKDVIRTKYLIFQKPWLFVC
jgi:hypothetical protein